MEHAICGMADCHSSSVRSRIYFAKVSGWFADNLFGINISLLVNVAGLSHRVYWVCAAHTIALVDLYGMSAMHVLRLWRVCNIRRIVV